MGRLWRQRRRPQPQTIVSGKIIAGEAVRAMRKGVTAMCYGGDATRKSQAGQAQKGEAKMRQYGNVNIPQEAFIKALKMGDD